MIRVLVADDEKALRDALSDLVSDEPDLELVGAVAEADDAIALAADAHADVALLDVKMPGGGPHAARGIAERAPKTRVLGLSAYEDRATVLEMVRAGAIGYLVKGTASHEILEAIRRAARDQASVSAPVLRHLAEEHTADDAKRRRAEEVLRRSEARFRGLLESAPDAVVITDVQGRIVLVNQQTEVLFGYPRGELLGRSVETLTPEAVRGVHPGHRADYLSDPRTRPMGAGLSLMGRRRDGTTFPVDISLSAIDTSEGRLVTAFIRDVGERQEADAAQRKSEQRFAALLESAPDAVVIAESDGSIVLVNKRTEELFGFGRGELIGRPLESLLPERFRTRHVGHRAAYLTDPQTRPMGAGLALFGRRKDATEFPVDISLSTIETAEGRLLTAFVRDVTEQQIQSEAQRHAAERRAVLAHLVTAGEEERRRIAGDIHDDSIQAITAAGMRLQMLRRKLEDPDHVALLDELDETIRLSIGRLRHLLFELRPPALDKEGLSRAVRMYLDESAAKDRIEYELEDAITVQPDRATRLILYRIIQEALTNVRKHADADVVVVTLEEHGGGYLASVADDGVGFAADTRSTRPGHLGLFAVRERAELAGGWLEIESAPGEGTVVRCWIPADAGRSAPPLGEVDAASHPDR